MASMFQAINHTLSILNLFENLPNTGEWKLSPLFSYEEQSVHLVEKKNEYQQFVPHIYIFISKDNDEYERLENAAMMMATTLHSYLSPEENIKTFAILQVGTDIGFFEFYGTDSTLEEDRVPNIHSLLPMTAFSNSDQDLKSIQIDSLPFKKPCFYNMAYYNMETNNMDLRMVNILDHIFKNEPRTRPRYHLVIGAPFFGPRPFDPLPVPKDPPNIPGVS
jgi:hypothetical protein